MAIKNPQANFNWRLDLPGIDNLRSQLVTSPTTENASHKQGVQGIAPDSKSPGKKIVGDLVIELLVPQDGGDKALWDQFQSNDTLDRDIYAGDGFFTEVDASGAAVNTFQLKNAWIMKIENSNYETRGDNSGDLIRTVTFSVDDYISV